MSGVDVLKRWFGYDTFRPGQERVVDALSEGRDTLFVAATSTGKSLPAQLLTLIARSADPRMVTFVVSPLISLTQDQVHGLNARFGLDRSGHPVRLDENPSTPTTPIAAFLGSAQHDPAVQQKVARCAYAFVFLTPEKCETFLDTIVTHEHILLFVVDEAHVISEHGHDFRPCYRNLGRFRERRPGVAICALTATATHRVEVDILDSLRMASNRTLVRTTANRNNLFYAVHPKQGVLRDTEDIVSLVRKATEGGGTAIVYVLTRKETDGFTRRLVQRGIRCRSYHAGLDPKERRVTLEGFLNSDVECVVATVAFGMGIDKPNVRLVVHYGLPRSLSAYSQESGRAGRDGQTSRCILFTSKSDIAQQFRFQQGLDTRRSELDGMIAYVSSKRCRRACLLEHFGEQNGPKCQLQDGSPGCDRCLPPRGEACDVTQDAALLLRGVRDTGGRRGKTLQIQYLLGKRNKKVLDLLHRVSKTGGTPVHGRGTHRTKEHWGTLHDHLTEEGYLKDVLTHNGYTVCGLSEKGIAALQQQRPISLVMPRAFQNAPGASSQPPKRRRTQRDGQGGGYRSEAGLRDAREQGFPWYHCQSETRSDSRRSDEPPRRTRNNDPRPSTHSVSSSGVPNAFKDVRVGCGASTPTNSDLEQFRYKDVQSEALPDPFGASYL